MAAIVGVEPVPPDIELVATPGWREGALSVPPLSLLRDPAAAQAMAHVRDQLAALDGVVMASSGLPSLMPLAANLDAVVLSSLQRNGRFEWFQDGSVLVMDCGAAAEGLARQFDDTMAVVGGERIRWEGFSGFTLGDGLFVGRDGPRLVLGQLDHLVGPVQRLDQVHAAPADPAITLEWRLAGRLTAMARRQRSTAVMFDELLGIWRGIQPALSLRLDQDDGTWRGEAVINGLGRLPLGGLDGEVAAMARSGRSVTIGLHLDPASLLRIASAMPEVSARLPVGADALAAQLTGDCLVQAGWSAGPLPQGAMLLRLHDGAEAAPVVATLAEYLGGDAVAHDGADQSFARATVGGLVRVARRGERLVLGNDDALIDAWLSGAPGDAPLAGGAVLHLELDLPTIARQWLPVAWAALADIEESLGDDPLLVIDEMAWELRGTLRRIAPPASVSDALTHGETRLLAGREELRRIIPGDDLGRAVDGACALYVPDPPAGVDDDGVPMARLVLRFVDGFTVFEGENRRAALDDVALAAHMQGWKRLLGPDPAALTLLPIPEPVVFDARWLPPAAVALRHVPPYRLEITSADFSLRMRERGLPLVGLALIAAALELND